MRRARLEDEPALAEAAQDAAEIALIKAEVGGNLGRRRLLPVRELVEHASFRQRIRAVEEVLLQHADAPRVDAVEPADRADALLEGLVGHAQASSRLRYMT